METRYLGEHGSINTLSAYRLVPSRCRYRATWVRERRKTQRVNGRSAFHNFSFTMCQVREPHSGTTTAGIRFLSIVYMNDTPITVSLTAYFQVDHCGILKLKQLIALAFVVVKPTPRSGLLDCSKTCPRQQKQTIFCTKPGYLLGTPQRTGLYST